MIEVVNKVKCCGCYACYNKCPRKAINMIQDEDGFKYPKVDKEKCVDCGLCERACPIKNNLKGIYEPETYACISKNDEIRMQSSSGGVFSIISEKIINQGGIVFGASYDENFNLRHIYTDKIEDLNQFRGAKYLQSQIGDTYNMAKKFLEQGKYVLFTGTPCQIEGLKQFLGREYEKLYTQDIICHGVPSPKVWEIYKNYIEEKENAKIKKFIFRDKSRSWHSYDVKISLENHKEYKKEHNDDLYMKAFLSNIDLRDSCYKCHFKKEKRLSDITLGDFWGISKVLPEMNDDKGTSMVCINSIKGKELFESIKEKMSVKKVDFKSAVQYNPSFKIAASKNKYREKFFENLEKDEFDKLVKKYVKRTSILSRIVNKIKKYIIN